MKTPISYYGGKQRMLKYITPLVPDHDVYTEVYAGGAALFFAKDLAKVNVINDLNGMLINFYRTIVNDFDGLKQEISTTLHCREQFEIAQFIYVHEDYFTNVQKAWAVWMLSKVAFSGRLDSSFSFDKSNGSKARRVRLAKDQIDIELKSKLERSTLEQDDAIKVLKRYDTKKAFHFIDPPYVGSNMGHYAGMFNDQDLEELLNECADLEGKFMLTMYPSDIIKEKADLCGWVIHAIESRVTACRSKYQRKQEEWMVCNYSI